MQVHQVHPQRHRCQEQLLCKGQNEDLDRYLHQGDGSQPDPLGRLFLTSAADAPVCFERQATYQSTELTPSVSVETTDPELLLINPKLFPVRLVLTLAPGDVGKPAILNQPVSKSSKPYVVEPCDTVR